MINGMDEFLLFLVAFVLLGFLLFEGNKVATITVSSNTTPATKVSEWTGTFGSPSLILSEARFLGNHHYNCHYFVPNTVVCRLK
jgi:hypothetical protein